MRYQKHVMMHKLVYVIFVLMIPCKVISQEMSFKKLKNGFSYYTKRFNVDEKKVYIKLTVAAGAEHEADDQLELAHLLEHLAFKSTKHFPDVRAYLTSKSLLFGNDFGGNTNFRDTDYYLVIPSGDDQLLENCLQLVRDWAQGGIRLDSSIVNPERGVVLQEIGRNEQSSGNIFSSSMAKVIRSNNHNGRIVKNTVNNVKTFKIDALQRFYDTFYKPEDEAIVVLGDIDTEAVIRKVVNLFSDLSGSAERSREFRAAVFNEDNQISRWLDPRIYTSSIEILLKMPYRQVKTHADLNSVVLNDLITQLIQNRLNSTEGFGRNFATFTSNHYMFGNPFSAFRIYVEGIHDTVLIDRAFLCLMGELYRVKRNGFTTKELSRAKKNLIDRYYEILSKENLSSLSQRMFDNFLFGGLLLDAKIEYSIKEKYLNHVDLSRINKLIEAIELDHNRDVVLMANDRYKNIYPNENSIQQVINASRFYKPNKFVDRRIKSKLSEAKFFTPLELSKLKEEPSQIKSTRKYGRISATEIHFANGIKGVFKTVNDSSNRVNVKFINDVGNIPDDIDTASFLYAGYIVFNSGLASLNASDWATYLKEKKIGFEFRFRQGRLIFSASSEKQDFDKLVQITRLMLEHPQIDSSVFSQWKKNMMSKIENTSAHGNPVERYGREVNNFFLMENDLDAGMKSVSNTTGTDMLSAVKKMYKNTDKLSFIVCGDIDLDRAISVSQIYLGTLKTDTLNAGNASGRNNNIVYPFYRKAVAGGPGNTARAVVGFSGVSVLSDTARVALNMLVRFFDRAIDRRLRSELGMSYGTSVSMLQKRCVNGNNMLISVFFDCRMTRLDFVISQIESQFELFKRRNWTENDLTEVKDDLILKWNEGEKLGYFWSDHLLEALLNGQNPDELSNYPALVNSINGSDLKRFINTFSETIDFRIAMEPDGSQ